MQTHSEDRSSQLCALRDRQVHLVLASMRLRALIQATPAYTLKAALLQASLERTQGVVRELTAEISNLVGCSL